MPQAFIIIQIGNPELDRLCTEAIVPAIQASGLEARRVDKHNEGGLLKSEIVRFIQESEILVADVTNERPNVYLEIGYSMGVDKFRNLILTVREDHFPDSDNYRKDGPKVHFDLAGYDILRWRPNALDEFKAELEKRIRRRLAVLAASTQPHEAVWDVEWIETQRSAANAGLAEHGKSGFMEIRAAIHPPKPTKSQRELDQAAQRAPIDTFGWPIGVYLGNRDEFRPRPRSDGIVAVVKLDTKESFDYWAIRRNGDLYSASSLFEDQQRPGEIFFDTRIVRVTEALLYCVRLYSALGIDRSQRVSIAIRHGGLHARTLTSSSPRRILHQVRRAEEAGISTTLDDIEVNFVRHVKEILAPLFMLFDFFDLSDKVYDDIVNRFVRGELW